MLLELLVQAKETPVSYLGVAGLLTDVHDELHAHVEARPARLVVATSQGRRRSGPGPQAGLVAWWLGSRSVWLAWQQEGCRC